MIPAVSASTLRSRVAATIAALAACLAVGLAPAAGRAAAAVRAGSREARSTLGAHAVTLSGEPSPPGETPHSGNVIRAPDGVYYWYGDSYRGFVYNRPSRYAGVIVYWSRDLRRWHGPDRAFDAHVAYWQRTCMDIASDPDAGCFRAKVLYDAATRRYVMWLSTPAGYRALTSGSPLGPFRVADTPDLHDAGIPGSYGQACGDGGDESLFSGSGGDYLVYNRCGRLLVERLARDLLEGVGRPVQIDDYPEIAPFYGAEAPSLFRGPSGGYWIAFSLPACPYCAAATGLERAATPLGPWRFVGRLSPDSDGGQPDQVSPLGDGLWLDSIDLWRQPAGWPDVSEVAARQRWQPLRFSAHGIDRLTDPRRFRVTVSAG